MFHQILKKIETKITLTKNITCIVKKNNLFNETTHNQSSPQKNNVTGISKNDNKLNIVKYVKFGDVYHKPLIYIIFLVEYLVSIIFTIIKRVVVDNECPHI